LPRCKDRGPVVTAGALVAITPVTVLIIAAVLTLRPALLIVSLLRVALLLEQASLFFSLLLLNPALFFQSPALLVVLTPLPFPFTPPLLVGALAQTTLFFILTPLALELSLLLEVPALIFPLTTLPVPLSLLFSIATLFLSPSSLLFL